MRPAKPQLLPQAAAAACALGLLAASPDAGAVFIFTPLGTPQAVTLRVGSANTTVNRVTFTVSNANVSPNPTPVTGVPSAGTPATSPAGGVEIEVITRNPSRAFAQYTMTLTADSSSNLACVAGSGCGATIIPFTAIRWTSYNQQTGTGAGSDIQSEAFDGTAAQPLASYTSYSILGFGNSVTMRNVLVFEYDNATLYPSGRYLGRVVYTASNL